VSEVGSIPTRSRQFKARTPCPAAALAVLILGSLLAPLLTDAARAADAADSSSVGRGRGIDAPLWVMMRSAAFPGWGQLHNGQYFKAAVLGGVEAAFLYGIWNEDRLADRALERGDPWTASIHKATKKDYLWWCAFTILLSVGDAYVDAHLDRFDAEFREEDSAFLLRYEVLP